MSAHENKPEPSSDPSLFQSFKITEGASNLRSRLTFEFNERTHLTSLQEKGFLLSRSRRSGILCSELLQLCTTSTTTSNFTVTFNTTHLLRS